MPGDEPPPADERFRCPGCDEDVDVPAEVVGQLVRCPYCNADFFAVQGSTHEPVIDDTPAADDHAPPADELNAVRIRQMSALRRATLRTRSWWVIGLVLTATAAADLIGKAVVHVFRRHGWGWRPTLFTVAGAVLTAVAVAAAREAGGWAGRPRRPPWPSRPRRPTSPRWTTVPTAGGGLRKSDSRPPGTAFAERSPAAQGRRPNTRHRARRLRRGFPSRR